MKLTDFSIASLENLRHAVERHHVTATRMYISNTDQTRFRVETEAVFDVFMGERTVERIPSGRVAGFFMGMEVVFSDDFDAGTVVIVSDGPYSAVGHVRQQSPEHEACLQSGAHLEMAAHEWCALAERQHELTDKALERLKEAARTHYASARALQAKFGNISYAVFLPDAPCAGHM